MTETRRAFSGAPWEKSVGYCRALRKGPHVWVTGTVALDEDGQPYGVGDPEAQARRCLEIIEKALAELDVKMSDIVRTRMFVTDIAHFEAFGRAHGDVFRDHPPCTTMIEVSRFVSPEFMIEIEADAFVSEWMGASPKAFADLLSGGARNSAGERDKVANIAQKAPSRLQADVRWHILHLFGRLEFHADERPAAMALLTRAIDEETSKIAATNALQAIVELAERYDDMREEARRITGIALEHPAPAVRARARILRRTRL